MASQGGNPWLVFSLKITVRLHNVHGVVINALVLIGHVVFNLGLLGNVVLWFVHLVELGDDNPIGGVLRGDVELEGIVCEQPFAVVFVDYTIMSEEHLRHGGGVINLMVPLLTELPKVTVVPVAVIEGGHHVLV